MDMERRKFIKTSCLACASVVGLGGLLPLLQSCASIVSVNLKPENGIVSVPREKFTETNKLVIVKNFDYLDFDIAVVQYEDNSFKAFEMQCTHQPNYALTATKDGFFCSAHGSVFGYDGQVKTKPAKKPMKEYPVEITSQILKIKIT